MVGDARLHDTAEDQPPLHTNYPDNLLTLLQTNSHVYVDVAGLI